MRALSPAAGIAWQELMSYPALGGATRAGIEEVCALTGTQAPIKLAFGTEAGHYAARGSRPWCAAPATSGWRTSPTSTSSWLSWSAAPGFCASWCTPR